MRLAFSIPGRPKGKERVDQDTRRGQVHRFAATSTLEEEKGIAAICKRAMAGQQPFTGPVMIKFVAVFAIPPSWPRKLREIALAGGAYHTAKPDKDNIEKLLWDALKGVAWCDDSQAMGGGIKRYGQPERVDVTIEELPVPEGFLTPGQRRLEAMEPWQRIAPPKKRKSNSNKSGSDAKPSRLQLAVMRALDRDGSTKPATRGLFPRKGR